MKVKNVKKLNMESIVKVEHLSHKYSVQWAVRDISLIFLVKEYTGCWGLMVLENPR